MVGDIKNKTLDEIVDIYFPSIPEIKGHAEPIKLYCAPELDIAFLQLQEKPPEQTSVADLGDTVYPKEHKFQSFGFRNPEGTIKFQGLPANGTIQAMTRLKSKDNTIASPLIITLKSDQIAKGMSGAALLDTETNKIAGIISERFPHSFLTEDEKHIYRTLSFAIPVESIIKVYPELRNKNAGLRKFNNFIQLIGKSGSFIHEKFEDVYVAPIEYEEIEKDLKEYKCVFITGSAEYGKTFTAIKLLWELYKNSNYTPRYIEEGSNEKSFLSP